MLSLKIVLLFLCVWTAYCSTENRPFDPKNLNEEKGKDAFTCIDRAFCTERKPEDVWGIVDAAKGSAQLLEDILKTLSKDYNFVVKSTEEEWLKLPDHYCAMLPAERLSRFTDMSTHLAEFYKKNECELKHEKDYCVNFDKSYNQGEAFLKKFIDLKVCGNSQIMAKQNGGQIGKKLG